MSDQGAAAREVYHSIIDQELEVADLLEQQVGRLEDKTQARIRRLARKVYRLRVAGELTASEARKLFVQGFTLAMLAEYAHDIPKVKGIVDESLVRQVKAVKALDVPVRKLQPITEVHIKARATERAAKREGVDLQELPACDDDCECHGVGEAGAVELAVTGRLKGPGRGRLPSLENLKDKEVEELLRTLERFGLEPDVGEFNRRARQVYEQQLRGAIEGAGYPDKHTWAAIDAQLDRAAVSILRQQTKRAVQEYRTERLSTVAERFVWIAVGRGSCPSCIDRHGKSKTMKQWRAAGMPGSPVLICQKECRCSLQPDFVGEEDSDLIAEVVDEALAGLRQVAAFR
jgi:hypothetical protein